jgi:hypothetical protein
MKAKVGIIVIIIAVIVAWSNPRKGGTSLETFQLRGKVKSLRETSYVATMESGKIVRGEIKRNTPYEHDSFMIFNRIGNIESVTYSSMGIEESQIAYSYNERGNQIGSVTYNSKGESVEKVKYFYKENDNKTECYVYGKSGDLSTKFTFEYDDYGNLISNKIEPLNKSIKAWELTYKYDDRMNVIEQGNINPQGSFTDKLDYVYDKKSRVIEKIVYSADNGKGTRETFRYDRKGNVIEECDYNHSGILVRRFFYKFNKPGNMVELTAQDSTGKMYLEEAYEYTYDREINWIKKIIFEQKVPIYILEREIEYYCVFN